MKGSTRQIVLSCEHGGNRIPAAYKHLFARAGDVLTTHRGLDIGALAVARRMSSMLSVPLVYSDISRLLVELNRSRHHHGLFSEYTRDCGPDMRERILQRYYFPYRQQLETLIRDRINRKHTVTHLSIHSFTPELDGKVRSTDIGLLYDPARPRETAFCREFQEAIQQSGLRVRRNYPYRGNADGMTTHLRSVLPAAAYLGIEIEINQKLLIDNHARIAKLLINAVRAI